MPVVGQARVLLSGTIAVLTAAAFGVPASTAGAERASATPAASTSGHAPSASILLGAAAKPQRRGESYIGALQRLEQMTGRTLALHRTFLGWTDTPITKTIRWDLQTGHLPVVSVKPRYRGRAVRWSRIASGAEDRSIIKQADAFKALGKPVILTLHHEPENDLRAYGTPADFAAAFRHYVRVFRSRGANNVRFAWIMMAYSFWNGARRALPFYPGDSYVSYLAADGYNWGRCRRAPWYTFDQVFAGFREFGRAHPSMPLLIAEFGSEEDPRMPGHKAQWLRDAAATLRGWPQVRAVSYFNTLFDHPACRWQIDSSPTALSGWRALAHDPYLRGSSLG